MLYYILLEALADTRDAIVNKIIDKIEEFCDTMYPMIPKRVENPETIENNWELI